MNEKQLHLLSKAKDAALNSYSPYSKFRVGAAVLANDKIYLGANIENASLGLSICAERVALSNAIFNKAKDIEGIAVFCIDAKKIDSKTFFIQSLPCGACRQWISELAPNAWIVTNGSENPLSLKDLLPNAFNFNPD